MKKISLILTLIVVFTIGTFNIASAKPGKVNPGQAKKQEVTTKAKVAPGQAKKALPSVIKIGRLQLPVSPIVKGLGAVVTWNAVDTVTITKGNVTIVIKVVATGKKTTKVTINGKEFVQKGNGVINPTSYIKSLLKVAPTPTPTPTVTPSSTPTPTPTATPLPIVDRPTIIDKTGSQYNGQGIIRLPAVALVGDSYVYAPIQDAAFTAPTLGTVIPSWSKVVDGDTIVIGASAALANGKHLGIAEINASNQLVRFFDITISGIADYVAATPGTYTGSVIYANIATFNTVLGDCSAINKTIVLTINGVDKTITFNRNYLGADAFASWTAFNDFVVKSENLNGTAIFTGADSTGLKFTTAIIPNIAGTVVMKTDAFGLLGVGTAVTGTAEAN